MVAGPEDVAAMCEAVEQCGCHLCVAKDPRPFTEAEVCRDDHAGALIKFA